MKPEKRTEELFALVRTEDPVPPGTEARVRARLFGAKRRRKTPFLPLAAAVGALLVLVLRPAPEPPALASAPERLVLRGGNSDPRNFPRGVREQSNAERSEDRGWMSESERTTHEVGRNSRRGHPAVKMPAMIPAEVDVRRVQDRPPRVHRRRPTPKSAVPPAPPVVSVSPVPPPAAVEERPVIAPAPSPQSKRRKYVPRAFVEFARIDWDRLAARDELPAYVQSIIARRDPNALLAALDRYPVDAELRLVRGELRAGAARCSDAVADFDALLGSDAYVDLHARAARGKDRCRVRH